MTRPRQQVLADRDKVISDAETEAAHIRQQAKDDADKIIKDTNLKAEAIDQLAPGTGHCPGAPDGAVCHR